MKDKSGKNLTDRLNIILLDLEEIRKKLGTPVEKLTSVEKWGLFFCYVDHDEEKKYINTLAKSEEGIMAAQKIISHMSKANENWFTQNSIYKAEHDAQAIKISAHKKGLEEGRKEGLQQGIQQGLQKGIQQGVQQGLQQKAREDAKNFKNNGVSVELIAKCTGLTVEEINAL